MTKTFLSGKVVDYEKVGEDVGIIIVEELESKKNFYCYYEKHLFTNLFEKTYRKKVFIVGTLEYIKVLVEEKQLAKRLLAIKIEEIEVLR